MLVSEKHLQVFILPKMRLKVICTALAQNAKAMPVFQIISSATARTKNLWNSTLFCFGLYLETLIFALRFFFLGQKCNVTQISIIRMFTRE